MVGRRSPQSNHHDFGREIEILKEIMTDRTGQPEIKSPPLQRRRRKFRMVEFHCPKCNKLLNGIMTNRSIIIFVLRMT